MKNIAISVIGIGILVVAILLVVFAQTSRENPSSGTSETTYPVGQKTGSPSAVVVPKEVNRETGTQLATAFYDQVKTPLPVTLGEFFVADDYALQQWDDGYSGGEVLLRDTASGWVVVPVATSVWSIEDLIQVGVPQVTAERLISARAY
jgi:hypothetical protein